MSDTSVRPIPFGQLLSTQKGRLRSQGPGHHAAVLFSGGLIKRGEFFKPLRQFRTNFGKDFFVAPDIGVDLVVLEICCGLVAEQRDEVDLVQDLGCFNSFSIVQLAYVFTRFFALPQDVIDSSLVQRVCRADIVRTFAGQDKMQRTL